MRKPGTRGSEESRRIEGRNKVERVVLNALAIDAAVPSDIRAFGDSVCHRSEPDLHFQEKPIHHVHFFPSTSAAASRSSAA